jgi:hypothetical protein
MATNHPMQYTTNINQNFIEYSNQTTLGVNYYTKTMPVLSSQFKKYPMNQLFSDNSLVVYKSHSLAPGGVGTVKNSHTKAKKT